MPGLLDTFRLLGDPTRLRIVRLLWRDELSVAELQEIFSMKQSRISSQLAQLKNAGLVEVRRSGKNSIYAIGDGVGADLRDLVENAAQDLPEAKSDLAALSLVLEQRSDKARHYFDQLAGKFGKTYCPGRSWKGLAETLLKLMPPAEIADLGAGEGTFSQLLAQRAKKVIAVDSSEKMVEFGSRIATENGYANLEYRLGDIESPPIPDASVDVAFFSQSLHHAQRPAAAVESAFRILKAGGRIVILDLLSHDFEEARELYADVWLGFSRVEVSEMLRDAGFEGTSVSVVDQEGEPPHFETLLAIGSKP